MASKVTFRVDADTAKAVAGFLKVVDSQKRSEAGFKRAATAARGADRGVTRVGRSSERAARSMFTLRRAVVAVTGAFGTFLTVRTAVRFLDGVRREIDQTAKDSRRLDLPVDQLGRLRFAVEQTGGDATSFFNAMRVGVRNASDALDRGLATQVAALESVGLTAEDLADENGDVVGAVELLTRRSSALQGLPGTRQLAFVQQFFGRGGAAILPLLQEGPSGIAALADEAERLGAAITPEQARAAEELTDAFNRVRTAARGLGAAVLTELEPRLGPFLDRTAGRIAGFADAFEGASLVLSDPELREEFDGLLRVAIGSAAQAGGATGGVFAAAFFAALSNRSVVGLGFEAWGRAILAGAAEVVADVLSGLLDVQELLGIAPDNAELVRLREVTDGLRRFSNETVSGNDERLGAALVNAVTLTTSQLERGFENARPAYEELDGAMQALLGRLVEVGEQARANARGPAGVPGEDEIDPDAGVTVDSGLAGSARFREGVADIAQQLNTLDALAQQSGRSVSAGLSVGIGDAVVDWADGTRTIEEAFGSMVESMLKDLARLLIRFAVLRGLSGAFGIPGGELPGLSTPVVPTGLSGLFGGVFHDGGVVPGVGERVILAEGGERVLSRSDLSSLGSAYLGSILGVARRGERVGSGGGGEALAAVAGVSGGGGGAAGGGGLTVLPVMVAGERQTRRLLASGSADPGFMEAARRNVDQLRAMLNAGVGGGRR